MGSGAHPISQHPLPPARLQSHPLTQSAKTINQEERENPEKARNYHQVILYCLGLHAQNPGLREVDLEPSPKRGGDKINRLRPRRKNTAVLTSCIKQPGPTNKNSVLREVDLEFRAKRGTNKTEALVSL